MVNPDDDASWDLPAESGNLLLQQRWLENFV